MNIEREREIPGAIVDNDSRTIGRSIHERSKKKEERENDDCETGPAAEIRVKGD